MTNSRKPRKMARRGRKPKGQFSGKLANFSTRIQPETREELERVAKATGQSISQLTERLLLDGLAARRDRGQDRALRALCFLIGQTAYQVVGSSTREVVGDIEGPWRPTHSWRSDPFFFAAFRHAVSIILEAIRPKGEVKVPDKLAELQEREKLFPELLNDPGHSRWAETFKSPEARGRSTAEGILNSLAAAPQMSVEERQQRRKFLEALGAPAAMLDELYGMPEAARDLDISLQGEQK
jgi:hypothetical protein